MQKVLTTPPKQICILVQKYCYPPRNFVFACKLFAFYRTTAQKQLFLWPHIFFITDFSWAMQSFLEEHNIFFSLSSHSFIHLRIPLGTYTFIYILT